MPMLMSAGRKCALFMATAYASLLSAAHAQQAPEPPTASDEIVITATQRSSSVQDVAIAVTPVTGELIRNSGVQDIQDLQSLVPSLQFNVSENETSATARLRGIGTQGSNPGLESSVGVIIDGVFRVRNGVALGDLGEVAQIEVLRGPQGTLFGRNTSAGLISIRTEGPDLSSFGAGFEGTYGNFDAYRVGGYLNTPIIRDVLGLRVFAATAERDGVITTNPGTPLQRDDNDRDFWTVRPQLLFEPSANLMVRIIGDYTERDESCCAAAVINTEQLNGAVFQSAPTTLGGPLGAPIPFGAGAQAAFAALGAYGPGGVAGGLGDGSLGNRRAFAERPYGQDIIEYGISGEVNWDLGAVNLTSITAYRDWTFTQAQDADFTLLDILFRPDDSTDTTEFRNFTQEVRAAGEAGPLDWLVGVFYANEILDRRNRLFLGSDFGRAFAALSPGFAALQTLQPIAGLGGAVGGNDDTYRQESNSIAVFTHNIIALGSKTDLTLGARFTHETKDFDADFNTLTGGTALALFRATVAGSAINAGFPAAVANSLAATVTCDPTQNIGAVLGNAAFAGLNGLRSGFCLTGLRNELDAVGVDQRREENEVTGIISLARQLTDNNTIYGSYSRGYKAGGFNLDRDFGFFVVGGEPNPQFEEETVDAFELGLKNTLLNGDLLLNVAAFYSFFDNFQLNTFNGFQFVVTSVPEVVSRGVELDYIWSLPIDGLRTQGGVSYTDARYGDDTDFILNNANPVNGQLTLFRLPGARLTNAPAWSFTHSFTYERPLLNEQLMGLAHVDVRYISSQFTGSDLDPVSVQPGFVAVNARIGVNAFQDRLGVEVWARNLFDTDFHQIGFNVPLQSGARAAFLGDPRTFGVTVRARY